MFDQFHTATICMYITDITKITLHLHMITEKDPKQQQLHLPVPLSTEY